MMYPDAREHDALTGEALDPTAGGVSGLPATLPEGPVTLPLPALPREPDPTIPPGPDPVPPLRNRVA